MLLKKCILNFVEEKVEETIDDLKDADKAEAHTETLKASGN